MEIEEFSAKLADLAKRAARDLPAEIIAAELQAVIDQLLDDAYSEQPFGDAAEEPS